MSISVNPDAFISRRSACGRTIRLTRAVGAVVMGMMSDPIDNHSSTPVHVALCVDADALDRFEDMLRHLVVGLVDQAVQLCLISADARVESLCLGPVQSLTHERMVWPAAGRRLKRLLNDLAPHPPTIVHAFSSGSYALARDLADAFEADAVLSVTSLADCEAIAQTGVHGVERIVALSDPLAAVVLNQLNVPADRVSLIRPGVQTLEHFASFAQPDRIPTIVSTSPLERGRGIAHLIDSVDLLKRRGHDLMLFLLGRGRREERFRKLIRDRGLSSIITVAHPIGDVTQALRNADIFVLPAQVPILSADTLQAMGAGVAVVAFPNSLCDYLVPGETAVVCQRTTQEALADAIEGLLRDRSEAQRIATCGMEHVRAHHSVSEESQRLADVYRGMGLARTTFPITE